MKENTKVAIFLIILFWFTINLVTCVIGCMDESTHGVNSNCSKPIVKAELIFPGYMFGCWIETPLRGE